MDVKNSGDLYNMADNIAEKLSSIDFIPEKYVRELSQRCVGGQELQQQRKLFQALSESTNVMLKKNVYKNYMQFIETAKEITHLESEMYQLSHLLTEQKLLLEHLADSNGLDDSSMNEVPDNLDWEKENGENKKQKQEERARVLTSILEKVEGCTGLLEIKDRLLLHEGDLIELDPVENNVLQKTHAYLFSDSLMLTSWIAHRRGPVKYKMYAMYNLNSMAVVNIRDVKPIEKAFKILAYPDTRIFQCSSIDAKKEWLEHLEQARKTQIANEKLKRESSSGQNRDESSIKTPSIDSPTAFFDEESIFPTLNMAEWFIESPEEVDVLIAERHFEDALELLIKSKNYIESVDENLKDSTFTDIMSKIEIRRKNLIEVLMNELEVSAEKSLQGGLRAARRAVRLLISLGKTTQACELMLRFCTSILKKELKCVRREGATFLYIEQSGRVFYSTLLDVVEEFQKVFPLSPACSSALVVWSNSELTHFISHVVKQVFVPQSTLKTVSECVSSLRQQNSQLCKYGLDLGYQMEGMLQKPLTITLQDAKDKLTEAIKHRSSEDKWHPMNLQNKNNLNKLLKEFGDLGVTISQSFITGDYWIELTPNIVAFSKSYLNLLEDCLRLFSAQLYHVIEDVLYETFHIQLRTFQVAVRTHKQEAEALLVDKNLKFLIDILLKVMLKNFEKCTKVPSAKLSSLALEFNHLKQGIKPKPAPRSITKYSSEEFI